MMFSDDLHAAFLKQKQQQLQSPSSSADPEATSATNISTFLAVTFEDIDFVIVSDHAKMPGHSASMASPLHRAIPPLCRYGKQPMKSASSSRRRRASRKDNRYLHNTNGRQPRATVPSLTSLVLSGGLSPAVATTRRSIDRRWDQVLQEELSREIVGTSTNITAGTGSLVQYRSPPIAPMGGARRTPSFVSLSNPTPPTRWDERCSTKCNSSAMAVVSSQPRATMTADRWENESSSSSPSASPRLRRAVVPLPPSASQRTCRVVIQSLPSSPFHDYSSPTSMKQPIRRNFSGDLCLPLVEREEAAGAALDAPPQGRRDSLSTAIELIKTSLLSVQFASSVSDEDESDNE